MGAGLKVTIEKMQLQIIVELCCVPSMWSQSLIFFALVIGLGRNLAVEVGVCP